ncbi:site-specific integrase [Actinoplanes sp. NPDC051411]|uniref:site-specific integrase n=1 Tax=Actinoplanes sp. NPDC051411 TaxID=3155522 RepID=UPI0034193D1C
MLEDPSHGRWYYWIKVTDVDGQRQRIRRGGFPSEEAAIAAREAAITEPSPRGLAGTRIVPLDDVTNEACRRHWLKVAANPRRESLNPDGAMFLLPDGRPVSPDYLTRRFARLVKLHDLPPIRLHDLRHEAASLMGAAGVEPHAIQQVLGHSSAVTTVDTYWQVFREIARAAVNASADLLRQHASRRRNLGPAILA